MEFATNPQAQISGNAFVWTFEKRIIPHRGIELGLSHPSLWPVRQSITQNPFSHEKNSDSGAGVPLGGCAGGAGR